MKKLLIILLSASLISGGKVKDNTEYLKNEIKRRIKKCRVGYSIRKSDMIMKYSKKHGLDALVMANLAYAESSFCHKKVNKYTGCVGMYQISPKWWSHLIYKVQDGKYAERAKTEPHEKFLKYIAVNTEISCIIISTYLNRYDGSYEEALKRFGGWETAYGKRNPKKMQKYLDKVLAR